MSRAWKTPLHHRAWRAIRQLLDQAAAGAQASYLGLGAFWHLPLSQLLGAELYGVRLIAPAPDDAAAGAARPPQAAQEFPRANA